MPAISYRAFTDEVLSVYSSGKHSRNTRLKMSQVLDEVGLLGVESTAELTTALVARYVASKGPHANPNTVNGLVGYLRAACSYAVECGYLVRSPTWSRVRLRPRAMSRNPPLTFEDLSRLLAYLEALSLSWEGHRLFALVATVAFTGVRKSEALLLRVEDLDLPGRLLTIAERPGRRLKTEASARTVPLPTELARILALWSPRTGCAWLFPGLKRVGPWTGGMLGRRPIDRLQQAARAVGIARVTWHGLRHSFGTHAVQYFNQPLPVVQRIMGHTDLRTTSRYIHLDDPRPLVRSVARIAYRDAG